MSKTPEAKVRDKCLEYAEHKRLQTGLVFHKRMHFGHGAANGWPDDLFVVCNCAHHWWVEFKREGGEATPLQAERHREMRLNGIDVCVINSLDGFKRKLHYLLGAHYE